jgi:hypothetical protein
MSLVTKFFKGGRMKRSFLVALLAAMLFNVTPVFTRAKLVSGITLYRVVWSHSVGLLFHPGGICPNKKESCSAFGLRVALETPLEVPTFGGEGSVWEEITNRYRAGADSSLTDPYRKDMCDDCFK